ncbi:hypothetical protein DdX_06202 [Ditylenchus destructor]|uniref:Uncharacterized protein n=1 Tax=Ditylenchus destructor TaxID=166010 RepID=A0AAD4N8H3_9BILA|nr:hypothetical protein DdX_06202 [Ditylenchus destructor]
MSDSTAAVQEYFKSVLGHFSCQSFTNHNHTYNYYPLPPVESHNQNKTTAPASQGLIVPPTEPMPKNEPDFYVDVRPEIPLTSSPNNVIGEEEKDPIPLDSGENSVKIKAMVMNSSDQSMYVLLPSENSDDRTVVVRPNCLFYWKEKN